MLTARCAKTNRWWSRQGTAHQPLSQKFLCAVVAAGMEDGAREPHCTASACGRAWPSYQSPTSPWHLLQSSHCTTSACAGEPGRCTSHQHHLGTFFQSNNCRSSAVHSQASRKKEIRGYFSEVSWILMLIEEISRGRRWPRTEWAPYYTLQLHSQQSILDLCARSHCCTVHARWTQAWPLCHCHSRMRADTACSSLLLKT